MTVWVRKEVQEVSRSIKDSVKKTKKDSPGGSLSSKYLEKSFQLRSKDAPVTMYAVDDR